MVRKPELSREQLIRDEQARVSPSRHGRLRICLAYPNSYHVAMSSLAYQWVYELTSRIPDIGIERAVADHHLAGRTLESGSSLADFDILAFSCSFELDAVNILRMLEAAGIPSRRQERTHRHPLVVVGGAVATINPLPLASAIDVFCLGSAERVWPPLLNLMETQTSREELLAMLAGRDGFFVPLHHLNDEQQPTGRRRRLEKRQIHLMPVTDVPASCVVTPHTEYSGRALVEMSRGCPEKCRYCWVSFNYGKLACYSEKGISERIQQLSELTNRIGLVATAVGDHPALAAILARCVDSEVNVALSSLRIPAMTPEVLAPLAASGARSVTIAPETGTDELRRRLGKPITNSHILQAVENAQKAGITNLKAYFIVGLPDETDHDLAGITELVAEMQKIILAYGRERGRVGSIHVGLNFLIPKPYTPFHREAMLNEKEARRRVDLVFSGLAAIHNVRGSRPSYRESLWQAYLSRAGVSAFDLVEEMSRGLGASRLHRLHRDRIAAIALPRIEGEPAGRFISSAPLKQVG